MKKYFLHDGNKEHGPYSVEDIKGMNLKSNDMVWCEGMDKWEKASDVDDLKEIVKVEAVPPPLAPTPPPLASTPPPLNKQSGSTSEEQRKKKKKIILIIVLAGAAVLTTAAIITGVKMSGKSSDELKQDSIRAAMMTDSLNAIMNNEGENEDKDVEKNNSLIKPLGDERSTQEEKIRERKQQIKNNYTSYYKVSSSYDMGPMGGVSNGYVTIKNTTEYPIDKLNVAVNIYLATGGLGKTFYVEFFNIGAYGQQTKSFPPFPRGTNVQTQISYVKASSVGL